MSVVEQSSSLNTSAISSQPSVCEDMMDTTRITHAKCFVRDSLKSRIFLGRYVERRLVDKRIGYRDIVTISTAEVDFKRDLIEAKNKISSAYPNIHWIGISDTDTIGYYPSTLCLWTEIDNQPFGPFWFQVKTIKYREDEIIVVLKCLRHISDAYLEIEPILTGSSKKRKEMKENQPIIETITLNESYNEVVANIKTALSIRNLKELITFLIALVIAIFTGTTTFISFLGNFVLALLREMSILIKNSTPMFLGFLDFLSKIVGGFYILMAMLFKPKNPVPINKRSITYDTPQGPMSNNYYYTREFD